MQGTQIDPDVREAVYARDSWEETPCCIYCGRPYPEVHHYVERSRGGLGIEENLVCLCTTCHKKLHGGDKYIKLYAKAYLEDKYPGWDEKSLVAKKGEK